MWPIWRSNRRLARARQSLPIRRSHFQPEAKPMRKLRVFLADDHVVLRYGLALLIGAQMDMEVVGQAGDGRTALQQMLDCQPDVVVMDVSMPGLNGTLVTAQLRQSRPEVQVVALTRHSEPGYIRQMLQAGAQ